ncbi:MAG: AbrB/MazE/SpoVT family DNA-binding domain-containing protein [Spirochaetia bacterium]
MIRAVASTGTASPAVKVNLQNNAILLDISHLFYHFTMMRDFTKVDSAGRIVIPKALRQRYGFEPGRSVQIVPLPDGISVIPEQKARRFIRRGPLLTIDTGAGPAALEDFDVDGPRNEALKEKTP